MTNVDIFTCEQKLICKTNKNFVFGLENDLTKHPKSSLLDTLNENKDKLYFPKLHKQLLSLFNTFAAIYVASGFEHTTVHFPLDFAAFNTAKKIIHPLQIPNIEFANNLNAPTEFQIYTKLPTPTNNQKISSYSGGKDSAYVALTKNSLPVHFAKLDIAARRRELDATLAQYNDLPNKPLIVPFQNTIEVHWSPIKYALREAATAIILSQIALDKGIKNVTLATYNRGQYETEMDELFQRQEIPLKINTLTDKTEEQVTSWLINNKPQFFEKTASCLVDPRLYAINRNNFTTRHPDFPLLKGQCGVCDKDVRINMYRLLHDEKVINLPSTITQPVAKELVYRAHKGTFDCCTPEPDLIQKIKRKYLV